MRKISFLLIILGFTTCAFGQDKKGKAVYNEDFKWTIVIPGGFEPVPQERQDAMKDKGKDAMENTVGMEIEDLTIPVFSYSLDQINVMESNYQPFDEADGSYEDVTKMVNEMMYLTLAEQLPDAKLDSVSSIQTVDGLKFYKFVMKMTIAPDKAIYMETYSRLFDKKDMSINITYLEEKIGKQMRDAFLNSKFKK